MNLAKGLFTGANITQTPLSKTLPTNLASKVPLTGVKKNLAAGLFTGAVAKTITSQMPPVPVTPRVTPVTLEQAFQDKYKMSTQEARTRYGVSTGYIAAMKDAAETLRIKGMANQKLNEYNPNTVSTQNPIGAFGVKKSVVQGGPPPTNVQGNNAWEMWNSALDDFNHKLAVVALGTNAPVTGGVTGNRTVDTAASMATIATGAYEIGSLITSVIGLLMVHPATMQYFPLSESEQTLADKYKAALGTLGITNASTESQVTAAYRDLVQQYHPDLHPGDAAAAKTFSAVNQAYDFYTKFNSGLPTVTPGVFKLGAGGTQPQTAAETVANNIITETGGDVAKIRQVATNLETALSNIHVVEAAASGNDPTMLQTILPTATKAIQDSGILQTMPAPSALEKAVSTISQHISTAATAPAGRYAGMMPVQPAATTPTPIVQRPTTVTPTVSTPAVPVSTGQPAPLGQSLAVVRTGAISPTGAYVALTGTPYAESPKGRQYILLPDTKIADTREPAVVQALVTETLKAPDLTADQRTMLQQAAQDGFVDYLVLDETPMAAAAKTLGYDAVRVAENQDLPGEASSIFVMRVGQIHEVQPGTIQVPIAPQIAPVAETATIPTVSKMATPSTEKGSVVQPSISNTAPLPAGQTSNGEVAQTVTNTVPGLATSGTSGVTPTGTSVPAGTQNLAHIALANLSGTTSVTAPSVLASAGNTLGDVVHKIAGTIEQTVLRKNVPDEVIVRDGATAIDTWRIATNTAIYQAVTDGKKLLQSLGKVDNASLKTVDDWLDNPSAYQTAFAGLPAQYQTLGNSLKGIYSQLYDVAQDAGVLDAWKENYTPHIYKDNAARATKTLYPKGGKLGTSFSFGKMRTIATKDEAVKLGFHPIDNPVLKLEVYMEQFYKVLANKHLMDALKLLTDENGIPLIMGKPQDKELSRLWENTYQGVNVPALGRFMYVGQSGETPMLVKMPAKASPEIASLLNNAFAPYAPKNAASHAYIAVRGIVKRILLLNPLIHGNNMLSAALAEFNFNPVSLIGHLHSTEAIQSRAIGAGLELGTYSDELRTQLQNEVRGLSTNAFWRTIFTPITALEKVSDTILWKGIVQTLQLASFDHITQGLAKDQPTWTPAQIDKTVADYLNPIFGTIPTTWYTKAARDAGSTLFLAFRWTSSNIDEMAKSASGGRWGLGTKIFTPEEKVWIGKRTLGALFKGLFGLLAFTSLAQLASLAVTNKLKKDGKMKGKQVPLHTPFQNEKGHWLDIDTGQQTNAGQEIYLIAPFFRNIRDVIGWFTHPFKNLYNKLEPLLKQGIEQTLNYSAWQYAPIAPSGDTTFQQVKDRITYFLQSVTPSSYFTNQTGRVKTGYEWLIPILGTYITKGSPGGTFESLYFQYLAEQKITTAQLDNQIDVLFQSGKMADALNLMVKSGRYGTIAGIKDRISKYMTPLNYYWNSAGSKNQVQFLQWLKQHGKTSAELQKALQDELNTTNLGGTVPSTP